MRVSIITVTFNSAATIRDTVLSVQKQSYKNIEHIIVDGASSDSTLDIVKALGHSGPLISEKDNGLYDAMNKGIALATGEVVGILNSDDYLADEYVIENIVSTFESAKCDAIYGDLYFVHPQLTHVVLRKWIAGTFSKGSFLRGWMPPHPTFYVRKACYDQYGTFNTSLRSSADYDLLIRLLLVNKIKAEYLPKVLIHMRTGGQSTRSWSSRLKAHKEDYKAWKLNQQNPKWYTLILKPLRKVSQFVLTPD